MSRRRQILLLVSLAVFAAPGQAAEVSGEARGISSGELLYRELHRCEAGSRYCTVEYLDRNGKSFAVKTLDYTASLVAPDVSFVDHRFDLNFSYNRESPGEEVVDAGFDNFIRLSWDSLAKGGEVEFSFLPVGSDRALNMKASTDAEAECSPDQLCLVASPRGWFLGLLLQPIRLVYDRDRRRLLSYRGMSNIKDATGKSQSVAISYRYFVVSNYSAD